MLFLTTASGARADGGRLQGSPKRNKLFYIVAAIIVRLTLPFYQQNGTAAAQHYSVQPKTIVWYCMFYLTVTRGSTPKQIVLYAARQTGKSSQLEISLNQPSFWINAMLILFFNFLCSWPVLAIGFQLPGSLSCTL